MKKQNNLITWFKNKNSSAGMILLIVAIILLNMVCSRAFVRLDITSPKSYSLSNASKEVVKTIEEPLSVKVFFTKNLPAPYSSVQQYVKDILVEYKNAANSNFSYEYFDMEKKENEKLAQNYGLQQIQIREVKNNEVGFKNVYMGIVITYADQIEKLDGISSSDGLEYVLTKSISKVISSTNALTGLSGKVKMTLYKSAELDSFGINGMNQVESVVQKAYDSANKKFHGKIEYNVLKPSSEESIALNEKYGIGTVQYKNSDGNRAYCALGLLLEYGDKFRLVPLSVQNAIFTYVVHGLDGIDENISLELESLVSKTSTVAYITGHGERNLSDAENGCANFNSILSDTYNLEEINLSEKDFPVGVGTAIINGSKSKWSDYELYKLDQFLLKGGSILLFADSFEEVMPQGQNAYYQMPQYINIDSGLEKILDKYGIKINKDYVMDENCYSQNNQQYGKLNFYYVPMLQKESLDSHNVISNNLGYVLFYAASSIDSSAAKENKDTKVTVLAKSSPKSWTESQNLVLSPLYISAPADKSNYKSQEMAVLVEGKFNSAFESAVLAEDAVKSSDEKFDVANHLMKSSQKGRILVISTSVVTSSQMLQQNSEEPIAMFLRNSVDYLNGNEDFCSMRTKNLSLDTLKITSGVAANIAKYFNQIGLAVLVAVCGLIVFVQRRKHRLEIRMKYNPDDKREISNEKEKKNEK